MRGFQPNLENCLVASPERGRKYEQSNYSPALLGCKKGSKAPTMYVVSLIIRSYTQSTSSILTAKKHTAILRISVPFLDRDNFSTTLREQPFIGMAIIFIKD